MVDELRRNDKCFVGMPSCGYGYESAKLCFVTCPSDDQYTLKLEVIEEILKSRQYECHVALRKLDPGSFAFCTKICSKIIQSQFCIILLDPSKSKGRIDMPNPNVHMEYGMMLGQNKKIIPLQHEKHNLAFNISPLDTIKYNDGNFKNKVTDVIDEAIKRFSEKKMGGQIPQGTEIFTFYNLQGYRFSDIKNEMCDLFYKQGSNLGFFLFDNSDSYRYLGPFEYEEPRRAVLHAGLLINNLDATYQRWTSLIPPEKEVPDLLANFGSRISIDILISASYDKKDVLTRIKKQSKNLNGYQIRVLNRKDIQKIVDNAYIKVGKIKTTGS